MILLHKALDIASILFIFCCVVAFEFPVCGIPTRYLLLCFMMAITFAISPKAYKNPRVTKYLFLVVLGYLVLTIYSLLRGNNFEDICFYYSPVLFFCSLPTFLLLFKNRGIQRYLRVFEYSCFVLIIIFLYILIRTFVDPGWGLQFQEESSFVMVANYDFMPRVVLKTFVFLIPLTAYEMHRLSGVKFHLVFLLLLVVGILSQTFGIVLAQLAIYFLFLLKKHKKKEIITICLVGMVVGGASYSYIDENFLSNKESSVDYKSGQLSNFTKDMNFIDFLLGRGIGCKFKNFDGRGLNESQIEVAAVQLFQSCGLLFSWVLLYVYLLPALSIGFSFRGGNVRQFLAWSQTGIFFASMSNPYIWSGGVGLLFIVFTISYNSITNQNQLLLDE